MSTRMTIWGWLAAALLFWFIFVFLPSLPAVRKILAMPLVVTDVDAHGDAAYLLAGGSIFRERVLAAVDLYHMQRVPRIILFNDASRSSYNFVARRNFTPTEWALDILQCQGVPEEKITILNGFHEERFGTLSEAKQLSKVLPEDVRRLVIVTSAAHTRRSLMTFRRVMPPEVEVLPYAATPFDSSLEMYQPLWLEYLKLVVYLMIV